MQVPLGTIVGKVACQCAIDIDRMGVVALDEVGVVAVHRPDEVAEAFLHDRVNTAG
uniref:Protein of unassigned function n=1 Tax=Methylobacterium oryzae CBMB20 TaxID=693986 RepID=A0A088B2V3_9HYPH|nr:protein of unassigned function [Methylobacterium oryzae CBMB20]